MSEPLRLEDILPGDTTPSPVTEKLSKKKKKTTAPRGLPKSGRVWKEEKKRFKSMVKTPGIKKSNSFKKQMKLKEDLTRAKTISRAREQERQEEKESKKERRRQNIERTKQNQMKSEIVQVIKNSSKIKKMRRKQLRSIEKRDVTKISK